MPREFLIRHMRLARHILLFLTSVTLGGFVAAVLVDFDELWGFVGWPPNPDSLLILLQTNGPVGLAWLAMGAVLLLLTLITYREHWILNEATLTHYGFFRTKQIVLDDVQKLSWWWLGRVIVVKGSGRRIPLFIDGMSPEQRRLVVRFLRERIPEERQKHWPMFARWIAEPLERKFSPEVSSA